MNRWSFAALSIACVLLNGGCYMLRLPTIPLPHHDPVEVVQPVNARKERQVARENLVTHYKQLVDLENQFTPELLRQNPANGVTYLSQLGGMVGGVLWSFGQMPDLPDSEEESQKLILSIMRDYGVTASFVDIPGRPITFNSRFSVPYATALALYRKSHWRATAMFRYFGDRPPAKGPPMWWTDEWRTSPP